MIDWDRVGELRDEIGAEDLAEVIEMFLDEVAEKLAELNSGQSPSSMSEDMHFLKSSALNIGFATLASLCSAGETQSDSGDQDVDLAAIEACYDASCQELRQHESMRAA